MEKFKLGFIYGRFQLVHKGHEQLINMGLEMCEKFVVLVGSSQESRTDKNPFTFEERKEMLERIYNEGQLIILPIVDIGAGYNAIWGNYLMNTIKVAVGEYPDFCIRGTEDDRNEWIDKKIFPNLSELIISRDLIKISASRLRYDLTVTETEVRDELIEKQYLKEEKEKIRCQSISYFTSLTIEYGKYAKEYLNEKLLDENYFSKIREIIKKTRLRKR